MISAAIVIIASGIYFTNKVYQNTNLNYYIDK